MLLTNYFDYFAIVILIRFTKLINATYSWSFFFFVGCNVLMTSLTGYQVIFGIYDEKS